MYTKGQHDAAGRLFQKGGVCCCDPLPQAMFDLIDQQPLP